MTLTTVIQSITVPEIKTSSATLLTIHNKSLANNKIYEASLR